MLIWGSRAAAKSRPGNGCTRPSAPLKVLTFATHYWALHCHTNFVLSVAVMFVRTLFSFVCLSPTYLSIQSYRTSPKLCDSLLIYSFFFTFLLPMYHCLFPPRALWFLSPCFVFLFHATVLSPSLWCHWPSASMAFFFSPLCHYAPNWEQQMTCTKTTVFKYFLSHFVLIHLLIATKQYKKKKNRRVISVYTVVTVFTMVANQSIHVADVSESITNLF